MKRSLLSALLTTVAGAALLSGCETLGPMVGIKPKPPATSPPQSGKPAAARPASGTSGTSGNPVSPVPVPAPATEQQALRDGIELYNKGAYSEAIRKLAAPEIAGGSRAGQLAAAKYSAFSYCVSGRQALCRQQFQKAFKLDSSFDLLPGEHGHPLWGPQFARAKKAR